MTLNELIRKARAEAGKSQFLLATELGIATRTLQRYEAGEDAPSFTVVARIADLTGKPLDFFTTAA